MNLHPIPAKWMLRGIKASSGLIKGQASSVPGDNLVPGFSASGQDVWFPASYATASGPGIILSAVGARCGKVFLSELPHWGTVANTASWGIAQGWSPRFVWYVLNDEQFWLKGGAAQPYVLVPESLSKPVVNFDLEDQTAIAAFLDRETAEIDAFIADQEELIALLTERRAATISHAVTKGLDPSAPMKDSGVPWLGEVPENWSIGQAKHYGEISLGKMLQDKPSRDAQIKAPYLRAANVQPGGALALESLKEMYFSAYELGRLQLLRGDVIIVEGGVGGFGRAAHVDQDFDGWGFQNSIIRLRPTGRVISGRFVAYQFIHLREVGYIEMAASVTSMPHFTVDKVSKTEVAWPQLLEQELISDHLDRETAEIDATIADAREAIALSKERRAALISAAVTGKIDVRQHGSRAHEGVE
ncbi:hypothetical protein ACXR2T_11215 [Leucobacter sp. HY1910]